MAQPSWNAETEYYAGSEPKMTDQTTPPHSTLPEAVPPTPVEDRVPKYYHQPADDTPKYAPAHAAAAPIPTRQNRFLSWPFLLLSALLIAVLSGLIGGFIGKAITESKQDSNPSAHISSSAPSNTCPTNTTSPPTSNNTTTTTMPLPITDCPAGNGNLFQSNLTKVSYRKYCNVDWPGADMIGFLALSLSDCIEACDTWNDNRARGTQMCSGDGDGQANSRECVGAVFAPYWAVNRTAAVEAVGKAANCYLKNRIQGYPANSREKDGVEIVGLCLEGKCPRD
ncbi:uncharacterized protein EI97DRAFT_434467 [Westerdykella ornata]|uniref:Apple domain-containing protein n=1 Tax=Westerdykella ornata TaxID=318751 RepID=A0A6A6JF49_WESOR|nr:uncharacterized protein EI97DRAFT_434467 [Westerdykella ornata]KAF2275240.1 hypothetical protein EI97DRAFT_434467 [Westerdykella ornata]